MKDEPSISKGKPVGPSINFFCSTGCIGGSGKQPRTWLFCFWNQFLIELEIDRRLVRRVAASKSIFPFHLIVVKPKSSFHIFFSFSQKWDKPHRIVNNGSKDNGLGKKILVYSQSRRGASSGNKKRTTMITIIVSTIITITTTSKYASWWVAREAAGTCSLTCCLPGAKNEKKTTRWHGSAMTSSLMICFSALFSEKMRFGPFFSRFWICPNIDFRKKERRESQPLNDRVGATCVTYVSSAARFSLFRMSWCYISHTLFIIRSVIIRPQRWEAAPAARHLTEP